MWGIWTAWTLESQLPFGSVPFRHFLAEAYELEVTKHGISIAFRLSAFSAQATITEYSKNFRISQLPFGSVPFRHEFTIDDILPDGVEGISIAFRLSAFSALTAANPEDVEVCSISIAFRLSAFSARQGASAYLSMRDAWKSQLPFGSVPFRHAAYEAVVKSANDAYLNCLSAQCLFGTSARRTWMPSSVSASQLPFGSVPFRHRGRQYT